MGAVLTRQQARRGGGDFGKEVLALGLMSGTSMDGIDAAVLRADGEARWEVLGHFHRAYDEAMRALLTRAMEDARGLQDRAARPGALGEAEDAVTRAHAEFVNDILAMSDWPVELIGFHGQTVLHAPERGLTVQIGDGRALADLTGVPVVWDMRANDVAHGGQGAPLAPAWHLALAKRLSMRPVMFVNIGGVSNVTWIGEDEDMPHAFDTGPGNALMDDLVRARTGRPFDEFGALAAQGRENDDLLHILLANPALLRPPPRSFDRNDFEVAAELVRELPLQDALATLCRFTARCIADAASWLPKPPALWVVAGGGRHNRTLMRMLAEEVDAPVAPAEAVEMDGDHMEAECWAWLAVRSVKGLPISWPTTTGARKPLSGGVLSWPNRHEEGGAA